MRSSDAVKAWLGDPLTGFARAMEPDRDRVLDVDERFGAGLSVRHAAGKLGNGREKAAAILLGQRFDHDLVFRVRQWKPLRCFGALRLRHRPSHFARRFHPAGDGVVDIL